ncbi:hypothetical protein R1sor_021113 [Riccia sorocarpa]|uniref:Uncharacterized protein n=1 Tax=Riccia sorocarpa TaxID=122646 RepID=A0ABD3GJ15_9MARC
MLRLAAFRPSQEKITHLQLHPTYPWLATADESGNVVVWDWEHRQVIYEVNAIGVDERRLAGAQLQGEPVEPKISKLSQAIKDIKGGSVKHVKFYDDDVRYWQGWLARAAISHSVTQEGTPPGGFQLGPALSSIRGRHFLVICCDSKAIFLDMVSMRAKDVPKLVFDNKSPLCVEFLPRSGMSDGPLAAFGGPDGVIRVLSMSNFMVVQRFGGAHKGPITCLKSLLVPSGDIILVSGGNDGILNFWIAEIGREAPPKNTLKAHDGGVVGIEVLRTKEGAPQIVTIGADKTLAVWDTGTFKELRRMKPVPKVACNSVAAWSHPRVPNLNVLTVVKDSHIWASESHYGGSTRALIDLTFMVPPAQLPAGKKLKAYCLSVHPLQPHLVATGTNMGVILCEFDAKAVPAVVALPSSPGSKEHRVVCKIERELRLLTFQLSSHINPAVINAGDTGARFRTDSPVDAQQLIVKQTRSRVGPVSSDSAAVLSTSHSGKYISVVWSDSPQYEIYRASDWTLLDQGIAKHFAWDSCKDRYALLQTVMPQKLLPAGKQGSSRKAREAAAAHAAAIAASAAAAAAAAKVEVRILLDEGVPHQLVKAIEGRSEPVSGLEGGALLGVAYKMPRKMVHTNVGTGIGGNLMGTTGTFEAEDVSSVKIGEAPLNFQFYSWETFRPVSPMLPQPEWTAWDETVEYCALAYNRYIVIASLRPQYRYLGSVAINCATGGVWHRRQLFIATPTTIECVFVDAGVSAVDLERKRRKEELKARSKSIAEHGELALLTVDFPKVSDAEKVQLRPPMLQVVRLASFQVGPSILKQLKVEGDVPPPVRETEEKKGPEVAIGGGGVSVAVSRLPQEQKRPVGPLTVVGVRDGVLWLVDVFMTAHAIGLSHPGIRCRCLAAYGDAVSAVKWASRLGREHHDDLAQFMLGMGYASEALHLPGISKRLEFDLAIQSGDLKRALQALVTLSNSKGFAQDVDLSKDLSNNATSILSVSVPKQEVKAEAVFGIVKFAREFLELVDAADATGQGDIARQALVRLAAAGSIEGGLNADELRALSFRLAIHGELTRLAVQANKMIAAGLGREAALAASFLGDPNLMEKAWHDTGMVAEAALHAQAHGRNTLKNLLQQWNKVLQKEFANTPSKNVPELGPAVDPVLAALESGLPGLAKEGAANLTPQKDGVLQSLAQPRGPVIEIVPPLSASKPILALTAKNAKSAIVTSGPLLALPAPAGKAGAGATAPAVNGAGPETPEITWSATDLAQLVSGKPMTALSGGDASALPTSNPQQLPGIPGSAPVSTQGTVDAGLSPATSAQQLPGTAGSSPVSVQATADAGLFPVSNAQQATADVGLFPASDAQQFPGFPPTSATSAPPAPAGQFPVSIPQQFPGFPATSATNGAPAPVGQFPGFPISAPPPSPNVNFFPNSGAQQFPAFPAPTQQFFPATSNPQQFPVPNAAGSIMDFPPLVPVATTPPQPEPDVSQLLSIMEPPKAPAPAAAPPTVVTATQQTAKTGDTRPRPQGAVKPLPPPASRASGTTAAKSFPLPLVKGGAQNFPLPMTTSKSKNSRSFPLPMVSSNPKGGAPVTGIKPAPAPAPASAPPPEPLLIEGLDSSDTPAPSTSAGATPALLL